MAVPLVSPVHKAVDLVALPCLVELLLVVHVKEGLQEAAAEPPEVRVLHDVAMLETGSPAALEWEGRAVGRALRLEEK